MEMQEFDQTNSASSIEQQTIDSLPPELLTIILKLLDLNSLLKCRMVSRKWKMLVDAVRIQSLSAATEEPGEEYDQCDSGNYWHINESINYTSTLFTAKSTRFMEIQFMRSSLSKIRRLFISYVDGNDALWTTFESFLSQLIELEQLQIRKLRLNKERTISLPSVAILSIEQVDYQQPAKLFVEAHILSKIRWLGELANLKLSEPSNITHLNTSYQDQNSIEKLRSFENCEYLHLNGYYDDDLSIWRDLISQVMLKLKEVHFFHFLAQNWVIDKLNMVKELKRPNLKLYIGDFLVSNEDDVYEVHEYRLDPYEGHNYEKLADVVTQIKKLHYSRIVAKFRGSLPADFNSKFVSVRHVSIDQPVTNKADLVNFIKNCKLLYRLYILDSSIDQSFYDALPGYCAYIQFLNIEEDLVSLDSSFIFGLKYLRVYKINQNVPLKLIRTKFNDSSEFYFISCMLGGKEIYFRGKSSFKNFESYIFEQQA